MGITATSSVHAVRNLQYNTHTSVLKCTSINRRLFKVCGPPRHWQTLRVITTKSTLGHDTLHFYNVLLAISHLKLTITLFLNSFMFTAGQIWQRSAMNVTLMTTELLIFPMNCNTASQTLHSSKAGVPVCPLMQSAALTVFLYLSFFAVHVLLGLMGHQIAACITKPACTGSNACHVVGLIQCSRPESRNVGWGRRGRTYVDCNSTQPMHMSQLAESPITSKCTWLHDWQHAKPSCMQTCVEKVGQWLHAHLGNSTQMASAVKVSKAPSKLGIMMKKLLMLPP